MSVLARQIYLEPQGATAPASLGMTVLSVKQPEDMQATSGRSLPPQAGPFCVSVIILWEGSRATTWGVECCKGQSTASFVQRVLTWNSLFFLQHQHTMGLADSLGVAHFGERMWTFKLSLSQTARSTKSQTRYLIRSFSVDREQDNIVFFPAKL